MANKNSLLKRLFSFLQIIIYFNICIKFLNDINFKMDELRRKISSLYI